MQIINKSEKLQYVVEHYAQAMYYKAYKVTGDSYEAEDAVQEALIRLLKVMDQIEDVTEIKAKALAVTVARNTAVDLYRKRHRIIPIEDEILTRNMEDSLPGIDEVLTEQEKIQQLSKSIDELPETYREVLRLRCLYEFSAEHVGKLLGINANTVNIRLTRARKLLKSKFDSRF